MHFLPLAFLRPSRKIRFPVPHSRRMNGALCADRTLGLQASASRFGCGRSRRLPMFRPGPGQRGDRCPCRCSLTARVFRFRLVRPGRRSVLSSRAPGCGPAAAEPQAGGIALASHLAIYDLKLANSRGKRWGRWKVSVQGRNRLRFLPERLRRLWPAISAGHLARQRRGQDGVERPAGHQLGGCRGQELPFHSSE